MRRNGLYLAVAAIFLVKTYLLSNPNLVPVSIGQIGNSKEVRIVYNLSHSSGVPCNISVYASLNGGDDFFEVHELSGDFGSEILPGNDREIIWNAGNELTAGELLIKPSSVYGEQVKP